MGSSHWVRATPTPVTRCEISISGLEPGWRYQFRAFAENIVGRSDASELSDALTVTLQRNAITVPRFVDELQNMQAVEDERIEFRVRIHGQPPPEINWFKDGYEIFSSRRTKIITDNDVSVLVIHQVALTDEGEIKCTATNRAGHVVTKASLMVQAPPKIRLPRTYEDGLIVEANEVLRLKIGLAGQPLPTVVWSHEGEEIKNGGRYEIINTERNSLLKIDNVARNDRGEYAIRATNKLGQDVSSFLVTVTARPNPPGKVRLNMSFGKTATLSWTSPLDDGGCKIGNYIVEYFRVGWNVWLKAATTRSLSTTLNDLIEGSEYKFRVKAENPYGVSEPSQESDILFIPDPKRGIVKPKSESKLTEDTKKSQTKTARGKTLSPTRPQQDAATETTHIRFSPALARKQKPQIIDNDDLHREMSYGTTTKTTNTVNDNNNNNLKSSTTNTTTRSPTRKPVLWGVKEKSLSRQQPIELPITPEHERKNSLKVEAEETKSAERRSSSPAVPTTALQRSAEPVQLDVNQTVRRYSEEQPKTSTTPSIQISAPESKILLSTFKQALLTPLEAPKVESPPMTADKHDDVHTSNEFMLVVFNKNSKVNEKDKQDSFELDLEDAIQPPPISISSPDLASFVYTNLQTFPLRRSVSSTELLYERAMARFYEAVELEEAEKVRKRKLSQDKLPVPANASNLRKRLGSLSEAERLSFERRSELRRQSTDMKPNLRWTSRDNITNISPLASRKTGLLRQQDSQESEDLSEYQTRSLPNRGESTDLGSDYTESTASSEIDSIEKFKLELMARTRSPSPRELETYHPRDMSAGIFTPYRTPAPEQAALVLNRPVPLPSPDFVPKPILKRPSNENFEANKTSETITVTTSEHIESKEPESKKEKGLKSFFKRDKPKASEEKAVLPAVNAELEEKRKLKEQEELKRQEAERIMHEEALAAVDHYSDLVSQVSQTRKYHTPLYLDKEELKKVTEKANKEHEEELEIPAPSPKPRLSLSEREQLVHVRQTASDYTTTESTATANSDVEQSNRGRTRIVKVKRIIKKRIPSRSRQRDATVPVKTPPVVEVPPEPEIVLVEQVSELEAHEKVRSALSYSTDLVLFLVACYVYLFKEARLVLPILALMIYRQLGEAMRNCLPSWLRHKKHKN